MRMMNYILSTIGKNNLTEVMDTDFKVAPVNRKNAEQYAQKIRGSVRLGMGAYRTKEEHDRYVLDALKVKM